MLAAAVVVPLIDLRGHRADVEFYVIGYVAAALQLPGLQPSLVQHGLHRAHMHRLAAVAGAQHRHLPRAETKIRRAPSRHEGQRLQRLEGGTGEGGPVRVAGMRHHPALYVGDGDGPEMHTLKRASAEGFD